jgi:hypothetical protein
MWHRPVIRAGVAQPEPVPLGEWTKSWHEAVATLAAANLATVIYNLVVIAPHATIEHEVTYG